MQVHILILGILLSFFIQGIQTSHAEKPQAFTLLHTNDLHSHFREDRSPLGLGGFARIKTAVDQIRRTTPALLVDGGDWSEGQIYYSDGFGVQATKTMHQMGYDVAVVGNHDFLNGPDILLNSIRQAEGKPAFIAANLDPRDYQHSQEFQNLILPYVIRQVGEVKVAFIGLTTYEFIYDLFISPVRITEPFFKTRRLASELKKQADAVVVISHNSIEMNRSILLGAPDVDLVIGAHDHIKLTHPIEVKRIFGKTAWIVETGSHGQYLGRVDLEIQDHKVVLKDYRLIQMDNSIPKDPAIEASISAEENHIEGTMGPIFHDHVGETEVEFSQGGVSSPMGNLATDAYRNFTKADFSMDVNNFIYGEIHRGSIRSVDVFNSNPAIMNPHTHKSWTLKTLPISGRFLKLFLNILYSTKKLGQFSMVNVSGLSFKFDPLFHQMIDNNPDYFGPGHVPGENPSLFGRVWKTEEEAEMDMESIPMVQDIRIQGEPIDSSKTYKMATGGGLIYAFEFLNQNILNLISLKDLQDTGVENWRVLSDYVHALSPITPDKLLQIDRIRTLQQDLGISQEDLTLRTGQQTAQGRTVEIQVRVRNFGASGSSHGKNENPRVQLFMNKNRTDYSVDPDYAELSSAQPIPDLAPGEDRVFSWRLTIPNAVFYTPFGVTARLLDVNSEVNSANNEVTRWFTIE